MAIDAQTGFYLDFQRFGDMKLRAHDNPEAAAADVARQFEGLFVQQMLAAMRSAARVDSGQQSSYLDFYQEMYDKQLAQTIAGQDRLGVGKLIMRQIPGADGSATAAPANAADANFATAAGETAPAPIAGAANAVSLSSEPGPRLGAIQPKPDGDVRLGRVVDDDFAEVSRIERANNRWHEPDNFVADIWPGARAVAQRLGVSPELLVAQSALETGWGRHTMKFDDGRSSYNLFGIKADGGWRGAALQRQSLEYRDGILHPQVSRFRAYRSPSDSLADYAEFIQSNPRYRQALSSAGNDRAYIRAIQDAGYATDPQYADKVIDILHGELLRRSLAGIDSGVSSYG